MTTIQSSILKFLEKLGLDVSVYRLTNNNIMIRCPFAENTHVNGTDHKPSFGIKIGSGGFLYNCFTGGCDHSGHSILEFVEDLVAEGIIKANPDEALHLQNSLKIEFPEYEETYQEEIGREVDLELREKRNIDNPKFVLYNNKRGIRVETLNKLDVEYDRENRIINFPVFDRRKKLVGFIDHNMGRSDPKYYNRDFDKRLYLYLEWLITEGTIGIVVEGVYDAILVYQHLMDLDLLHKYSVVSLLGTKVPPQQLDKLNKYFDRLILMGDNDVAGIDMEQRIWRGLNRRLPLIYKAYYKENDPGNIFNAEQFYNYISNRVFFKKIA